MFEGNARTRLYVRDHFRHWHYSDRLTKRRKSPREAEGSRGRGGEGCSGGSK